jgi:AraC-like DNA-binding protein
MRLASPPAVRLAQIRGSAPLYRGMKECFGFVVVQHGWVELSHRGQNERERAGGVRLIEPGEVYWEKRRSRDACLDLVLLSNEAVGAAAGERVRRFEPRDPRAQKLVRLLDAVRANADDLRFDTALCQAAKVVAAPNADDELLRGSERLAVARARDLLLSRFRENVRLDELAEHAQLDKFRLVRAFRARHGVPPYAYLTHARILQARRLLLSGAKPAEVASEVGYCDQSQLHRHFVRLTGTTPGRYRAEATRIWRGSRR